MPNDQVVVITGASRGMGAAAATWLAGVGVKVALLARSEHALTQLTASIEAAGGAALPLVVDVADGSACLEAAAKVRHHFNRIDALINNAGVLEPLAPVSAVDTGAWRRNIEVNLIGPVAMTRAVLPDLKKQQGRVINVSSGAAVRPIKAWSAYCAAKAALNHFTRVLAAEEPRVTAVAVRPGVVDTQMQAVIRRQGPGMMAADMVAYFTQLKADDKLIPAHLPARSLAWLALHAPAALSGEFVEHTDPQIFQPALDYFGDNFKPLLSTDF